MNSPIARKHIVNTRSLEQAKTLDSLLRRRGAVPLSFPCIAIVPPDDCAQLDASLREAATGRFDWIAFTSSNAVFAVHNRWNQLGIGELQFNGSRIAAVGESTAANVEKGLHTPVSFRPQRQTGLDLGLTMPVKPGQRVLIPVSDHALLDLSDALSERGAIPIRTVAYRVTAGSGGIDLSGCLRDGSVDALTFASPTAVDGFTTRLGHDELSLRRARSVLAACIGATTWQAAVERGFTCLDPPDDHSLEGLVASLENSLLI